MFDNFREKLARIIAPPVGRSSRMYAGAKASRLTHGWGQTNSSADNELVSSLRSLRSRSRALVRDAAYAKRAKIVVVNNVVGTGVGMQAQVMTARGKLNAKINDDIETSWKRWCRADSCHTGGSLHFADMERAVMGQIFEAGEVFLRKHFTRFGDSGVPYALELIEAERIADEFQHPILPASLPAGTTLRMGIECDRFYRPVAYWVRERHPGETQFHAGTDRLERVPAEQIIHVRVIDRWPQTRGEPWLHAVVRKLNDMDGYSEAEIQAARAAACYMGIIETPEAENTGLGEQKLSDGSREISLEPAVIQQLGVGEKFNFVSPNRPNANMDPFMRMMLREVAAGAGTSYESLSRDYSQSNYSSSRLALLDDRDLWRVLQMWMIRGFRDTVHREWLQQAVLAREIKSIGIEQYAMDTEKFQQVRYKPRGWSWVDPTREVDAYKQAVRCGFTTVTDVIANTGGGYDVEDVLTARAHELSLMAEKELQFDTDPGADRPATPAAAAPPDEDKIDEQDEQDETDNPPRRVVSFQGK